MAILSDYFDFYNIEKSNYIVFTDGNGELFYNKAIVSITSYTGATDNPNNSGYVKYGIMPKNFTTLEMDVVIDTNGSYYTSGAYQSGVGIAYTRAPLEFSNLNNCVAVGKQLKLTANNANCTIKYTRLYTSYPFLIEAFIRTPITTPVVMTFTVTRLVIDGVVVPIDTPPTDPYSDAGDSTTGGGGGTFDGSSDPVAVPGLPSVGATNTGFISLFVPSQAQLKQVADYLWGGLFDLSTYLKIFENPMDCILGLSVVPVTVPTSGSAQITVGNIELSGISLPLASQQYVEIDCGSISFADKFFGSYLDQDPYTKMALFVPYSGVHSVKADDIMGKTVNLKYHIDILTGSLVAFLTCGNSVLYEFNGACASNIPVNSINYASTIENAIRIAVNIGTTVATAGAAAPMTGATAATREAARTFGTAVNMAGSTAEGILSLKPNIDRAGSLGGTTGLMGNQTPYFIITRPRLCKPANQNTFKGYPSFIQVTIGDLIGEGYTELDTVILAGMYLTDSEKEELKQILESGVYL